MIYDYKAKDNGGNEVSLSDYKNKVLLIVNTATECGFTPQYADLQTLFTDYKQEGFEILDFPCNQFKGQTPGTNKEIAAFCTGRFGITFKLFSKIEVNGENEDPLYTFLKKEKKGLLGRDIKWNFTKFLVNRDGLVIKRYAPNIKPLSIKQDIEKLLA